MKDDMKVEHSSATLVKMIRAALKMWQLVAKYTTNPLLSQGVEGDMAMAKNSRRVFKVPAQEEERTHIAFEDKIRLITPEKAIFHLPVASRVQVIALANWEAAPTFVLDEHLGNSFPKVSTDRLLNKCNPFLSGKHKVHSDDDIASEAPTVSIDGSVIPESDVEGQTLNVVEEEVKEEKIPITLEKQTRRAKVDHVFCQWNETNATEPLRNKTTRVTKSNKSTFHWICVGYGRYVKRAVEQTPKVISADITKHTNDLVNGVTPKKAAAIT